MSIRKLAVASAAAVAFAGLLSSTPALAFTHHPATAEEIQQTDALNAQALANAQTGTKPNQPTASTATHATPSPDAPAAAAPAPDGDATAPDTMTAPPAAGTTAPPSTDAPTQ